MAKDRKLGTFGGVFTPSILTILGVIMYLRFPTIIGQAGLVNTIGIIVIAHIISITTSLSVASLSTDKTVKTGGTYFMISRSLGLPIGGTLGFALFVGLSFSVSLYLIGFAESFLTYWNLDSSINSVRITGTIILIVVTAITFISTSLAIKSQYFIMAAIVLSLISILLGKHDFTPTTVNFKPLADAAPFMLLFGIFFPAVTGFEAGVSMSGDLKNPKKSLPYGAIAAVGVGFIVYIGLAFFYAYTVDAEVLMNDSQVLFKIALVPVLVIAGIWGATLSSALGSILGAPRILQAIAMDRIAPKIFAKGTGKAKEPRNALLLAFIIAEAGILIGQLDVIARIVSMFFITTYAFLNLACAIESWSSSDFRPAFKIPKFISVIGAISAFIVMILLDFIALTGAIIALGFLLFFLRRKELSLETGDAWSSFWTNMAKRSLLKLTNDKTESRNWRPNIILFRGKKQERIHLVELGLAMSGKLGALTDFELIVNGKPEHNDIKNGKKKELQYFRRQHNCDSLEEGIKSVTSIYGFSGFEPNTVMMGWSHDTNNIGFLATIFIDLKKKNLNAIFLDYHKEIGFGKKENIDIWWNGKGRLLSYALNIIKFILSDPDWRDANVRILVINNNKELTDKLYRNTNALLSERRLEVQVKIINDDFGTRNKEIIIKNESAEADLVVMGISPNPDYYNEKYIEEFNRISEVTSSLLILNPSNEFEEINLITPPQKAVIDEKPKPYEIFLPAVPDIENSLLHNRMVQLDHELTEISNRFIEKGINYSVGLQIGLINSLKEQFDNNLKSTTKTLESQQGIQLNKSITKNQQAFLEFSRDFFNKKCKSAILEIKETLENEISTLKTKTGNYIFETPETIIIPLSKEPGQKEKNISSPYRKIVSFLIHQVIVPEIEIHLSDFELKTVFLYNQLKSIALKTNDIYEKRVSDKTEFEKSLQIDFQKITKDFEDLSATIKIQVSNCTNDLNYSIRNHVIEVTNDILESNSKKSISRKYKTKSLEIFETVESFPQNWEINSSKFNNATLLDFQVLYEQKIINEIIQNCLERADSWLSTEVLSQAETISNNIEKWESDKSVLIKSLKFPDKIDTRIFLQESYLKIVELLERLPNEIEISDFSYSENEGLINTENKESVTVNPLRIGRYYLDTRLYDPLYRELEQLDKIIKQSIIEYKEANSLLKFRLENIDQEKVKDLDINKDLADFLISVKELIKIQENCTSEALEGIRIKSEELVKNAVSPLYSHAIVESQNNISVLLREQKGKKFGVQFSKKIELAKENLSDLVVDLLYSSSSGVIQAKKYLGKSEREETSVGEILDIVEKEMTDPKVFSQIPVFYRTLFSSKSLINDDFWIPMEKETKLLRNALNRHNNGLGGAILLTGVHGSGKTTLSRFFTKKHFKKGQIFFIDPPAAGSVKKEDWLQKLQSGTGINGGSFDILRNLPHGSTLIINSLELWWERTNDGYEVLEEITKLIRLFGKKVLFIINSNLYAFNQIAKVFPLQDHLLQIVECEPFNAKKLKELILKRHKTSGLTFIYKNTSEENVSQILTASLFNSYFSYSGGIPGVAIDAWINHITKIQKQDIFIKAPEFPNIDLLKKLNPDWIIIIAIFIQHKTITKLKLARIMNISVDEAENFIYHLSNSRIIELLKNDTYEADRHLEPFLVKVCNEKGII